MKKYSINFLMTGILYLLGTIFGILSTSIGGKVISSIVQTKPMPSSDIINQIVTDSNQLLTGSFFVLLMGISLVSMTVFLYPIIKKDSEELAMGMILFRGVMEGIWYFTTTISIIILVVIGNEYIISTNPEFLESLSIVVYNFQDLLGPIGTILFLIGATCIYLSFYRTKIIPRWLSIWGLIGVIPYMIYALLHLFGHDNGIGFYLQMILAPQELVMAVWLIIKGFKLKFIKGE